MTNDYTVIGHGRDDADALLLLGDDGQHYAYDVGSDRLVPAQIDSGWVVDGGAATDAANSLAVPDPHLT